MRIPIPIGCFLGGAATLAFVTSCSSGGVGSSAGSPIVLPQSNDAGAFAQSIGQEAPSVLAGTQIPIQGGTPVQGFISPELDAPGGAHLFVSEYGGASAVDIFNVDGKLTGKLADGGGPTGLAIDKAGNLYVAEIGPNRVEVYAKGYKGTPKTLDDSTQFPIDVAVDSNGNVAVVSTGAFGPLQISFYAKGATSPTKTIPCPGFTGLTGDAFDAHDNLYVDGASNNNRQLTLVGEVVGGIKGDAITLLPTNNKIEFPGGIQVTAKGLVAITDEQRRAIYTYNAPTAQNPSLGSPVFTTPLIGSGQPYAFTFDQDNESVVTADFHNNVADQYDYPAGGAPVKKLVLPGGGGRAYGVAVYPPVLP